MALPSDRREFESWRQALTDRKLTPDQLSVLEGMVVRGQAENVQAAAEMLDWQEGVIDPEEHMYGA